MKLQFKIAFGIPLSEECYYSSTRCFFRLSDFSSLPRPLLFVWAISTHISLESSRDKLSSDVRYMVWSRHISESQAWQYSTCACKFLVRSASVHSISVNHTTSTRWIQLCEIICRSQKQSRNFCIIFTVYLTDSAQIRLTSELSRWFCIRRVCKFVFINMWSEKNVYDSVHSENQLCQNTCEYSHRITEYIIPLWIRRWVDVGLKTSLQGITLRDGNWEWDSIERVTQSGYMYWILTDKCYTGGVYRVFI